MQEILVFQGKRHLVEMARHLLANNDIPSLMKSEHGAGLAIKTGDALTEYYLFVAQKDLERARELCSLLNEK